MNLFRVIIYSLIISPTYKTYITFYSRKKMFSHLSFMFGLKIQSIYTYVCCFLKKKIILLIQDILKELLEKIVSFLISNLTLRWSKNGIKVWHLNWFLEAVTVNNYLVYKKYYSTNNITIWKFLRSLCESFTILCSIRRKRRICSRCPRTFYWLLQENRLKTIDTSRWYRFENSYSHRSSNKKVHRREQT